MSAVTSVPNGPFLIIMNAGAGHNDTDATRATIEQVLTQAGRAYRLILVEAAAQLGAIARKTVEEAKACNGIVVVAGGDGSINSVANAVLGSGCPFGVLPQGTFNYFARAHGIPEQIAESTQALLNARVQPVQVGLVNDRLFLVNASVGLYPQLLEDREAFKKQFGRSRLVAFWSGLVTLLRQHRQLRVSLEQERTTRQMRTLTLFVGNNPLQIAQLGIPLTEAVEEGHLAAIILRPVGVFEMLWLVARGALGRLGDAENIHSFSFKRLTVKPSTLYRVRRVKVATDGEVIWLRAPLEFRVSPEPLYLLKPVPAPPSVDTSVKPSAEPPQRTTVGKAA